MKTVSSEAELRSALKEKTREIMIVASYADKVMERYGTALTAAFNFSPFSTGPLPIMQFGLARYLQFYRIQSYTSGRLVIERRN